VILFLNFKMALYFSFMGIEMKRRLAVAFRKGQKVYGLMKNSSGKQVF